MKYSQQVILGSLLAIGLITACQAPPPPVNPFPFPSLKPSATPTSTPTPEPTATALPSATPSPSSTPTGSATPVTVATPVAPTATASPTSATPEMSVLFRASYVNDKREVIAVPSTIFTLNPYEINKIKAEVATQNKVEPKPVSPSPTEAKYQTTTVCTSSGCTVENRFDSAAFQRDIEIYQTKTLPDWEKRAYQGLDAALQAVSQGRQPLTLTTDANGEANIKVSPGTWYISGTYSAATGNVSWQDVRFDISTSTARIELR